MVEVAAVFGLSDFSFMGKKWGKNRFTGKKWGTSESLQTGNQSASLSV